MTRLLAVLIAATLIAAVFVVLTRHSSRLAAGVRVAPTSTASPARMVEAARTASRVPQDQRRRAHYPRRVLLDLSVTAYCESGNRTASGVWPEFGMAAGNRWPFGTRIRVPGWGVVTVTDRIGWGSELDLFAGVAPGCEGRAITWGRRQLLVEVLAR